MIHYIDLNLCRPIYSISLYSVTVYASQIGLLSYFLIHFWMFFVALYT